jgi:hypothetical protein
MSEDAVVKIGAIVSTDQLQEGMATSAEAVQSATQGMGVSFQELSTKAQAAAVSANRAFTSISADTKAAVAGLSEQALKEAQLAKMRIAANTEVRTSIRLMNNEQFNAATATALYAAASEKVVAIDAEIAVAHKETAAAAEEAALAAKLSSNVWVASMQRILLSVKEAATGVEEKFVEMAEAAKLSEAGIGGGFAALGGLLGAAIGVGFAAHFLDELAKMNVELDHLSAKTGISVSSLSGLQLIVREMGGEFEPIALGLVKMEKAQALAAGGSKPLLAAFAAIGISVKEVKSLNAEQMLERIAQGFEQHTNHAVQAAVATALFGRGGQALIPILREQGSALEENIKQAAKLTGVNDESAEAARRWTKDMADLSAESKSVMMPVLEHAGDLIAGIAGDFEVAAAIIFTAGEAIVRTVQAIGLSIATGAKLAFDVGRMDFGAAKEDAEKLKNGFVDTFKSGFTDVKDAWNEALSRFKAPPKLGAKLEAGDGGPGGGLGSGGGGSKKDHAAEERMHAMEQEYGELQQAHKLTLKEEHDFWASRIGEFAKGTEQYRQLTEKLGQLDQQGAKKAGSAIAQFKSGDPVGAMDSLTGDKKPQQDEGQKDLLEGQRAMAAWSKQIMEDLEKTGERWRQYHEEVARGAALEATNAANMQLAKIAAAEAEGTISKLGAAKRIAAIHTVEYTARLKELEVELERIAKDENLSPVQKATQSQGVQNQITQLQGQGQQSAAKDTAAINAAITQPYLKAFDKINQGWLKVQNDLIAGNRNISRDFAQMGVKIVQGLAQNFEQMLVKHAEMWLKMQLTHATAVQAGVAVDAAGAAQSDGISLLSALKQMSHAAAVAAGKAWSAMADIPIIGPELGAIAAAATYAGVMALAAFEQGGVVGGQPGMAVPILAHSGERVLTTSQTNNFERMVNNNNNGSGGGARTMNATINQNFGGNKSASSRDLVAGMQMAHRRGKLSY